MMPGAYQDTFEKILQVIIKNNLAKPKPGKLHLIPAKEGVLESEVAESQPSCTIDPPTMTDQMNRHSS